MPRSGRSSATKRPTPSSHPTIAPRGSCRARKEAVMSQAINRREFLTQSAGVALALGASGAAFSAPTPGDGPKKAVLYGMLPGRLSREDRFKLARDVGFAGVEAPPIDDPGECEKVRAAAEKAGIRVHSV